MLGGAPAAFDDEGKICRQEHEVRKSEKQLG